VTEDLAGKLIADLIPAQTDAEAVDDVFAEAFAAPVDAAAPLTLSPTSLADELTERDQAIIAFERQWWRHAGAKEQAIRDTFGLSSTRYYQVLNGLLDRPAALAFDPMVVKRLRRLRTTRSRGRRLD
jgi:hypothetical protein